MSLEIKHLADGQIPTTKTALYTVDAGYSVIVRSIHVSNVDSSPRQFILYFKKSGGTSRQLWNRTIGAGYSCIEDESIPMNAGDSIEGNSPAGATYFDYRIGGTKELLTL